MSDAPTHLLWLDIETTGLEPFVDVILEVAAVVTTADLSEIVDTFHAVVRHPQLPSMAPVVEEMHSTSGLFDDLPQGRKEQDAVEEFAAFVADHPGAYLAGSGVHFDRRFVTLAWGADVLEPLHYRHVDVSTLRTFCKVYAPDKVYPAKKAHRAQDDVADAIDELRHYRRVLLG